ncbi:DUF2404 domain-containing protein [Cephalotus follicularis]|uniref:DUF2404 domain-containing protein n=1 Tax=Cephalotus follicularis TaxID=3775 RepID=A0A1Q3CFE1_CEPFO|nr:DUF2404 domain-containing protein [Cephalotus follicularis]
MLWSFVGGLLLGALTILVLEAMGLLYVIKRLNQKAKKHQKQQQHHLESIPTTNSNTDLDPHQSLDSAYKKQGIVWVLQSEKVPKNWPAENAPCEHKRKKDFLEVSPVRKFAKIEHQSLILSETHTSHASIPLKDCIVEAVSASSLPSRKWAKRFPIKVESKTSLIYNGSRIFYIYLETSWEKESWCRALRLASCGDKERLDWVNKLSKEFQDYVASLNTGYPSFMKPSVGFNAEQKDKDNRLDGSTSKVHLFWKKLAKKAAKPGVENKGIWTFLSGREDRKINEKLHPFQDSTLATNMVKDASTDTTPSCSTEDNLLLPSITCSGSQSHISVISDADSEDKFNIDEGTLCCNLLISRLFFDVKRGSAFKSSMQARIQRTLSNLRTPSYIGEIICTGIDLGNVPPYIHGMRVLPANMNEVWALEVDVEYSGGVTLDIETRLEVRELDQHKGIGGSNAESISFGSYVSSDLLEGFEHFGKQFNLTEGTVDAKEQKIEGDSKPDGLKSRKSAVSASPYVSRWKSILNSIAKQVSQVPLSLSIRVANLRATVRLHIKPPPSDQLWFSFTSMPHIEFDLESFVGDHKITSGQIALLLINRFKASIRETMVLPNCESVGIPWMLAEKDDWVPRKVAPFIWLNQEALGGYTAASEASSSQPGEAKTKIESSRGSLSEPPETKQQKTNNVENIQQQNTESSVSFALLPNSVNPSNQSSKSLQELRTTLLASEEPQEPCQPSREEIHEYQSISRSLSQLDKQNSATEDDNELLLKRTGRKARILDLGKKMGEKLEEKRRHIEEKSRHIVEKMRGA